MQKIYPIIAGLALLVVIAGFQTDWSFISDYNAPGTPNQNGSESGGQNNPTGFGYIEGSLSFPSEQIPPTTICAVNQTTGQEYCTSENIEDPKYTYGTGYELQVPTGKYVVYALSKFPGRAYYNEFVTCGLRADCPSHKVIIIEVKDGQTTTGVDPQDWYNPEQQY